ncbi:MAG: glycosyltransferase family protein [Bacteroidota bacterium]
MKILITGPYTPGDNRVRVLTAGLRAKGISVIESPYTGRKSWDPTGFHRESGLFDLVYMPAGTGSDLPYIGRKIDAPVLFDAMPVTLQSAVFREAKAEPRRIPVIENRDYARALHSAAHVLAESHTRARLLESKFRIDPAKFTVIPEGTLTGRFLPSLRSTRKQETTIGMIIRGRDEALLARLLRCLGTENRLSPVRLDISVAGGRMLQRIGNMVRNSRVPVALSALPAPDRLPEVIGSYDICLAGFDSYRKDGSDLPGDLFHFLAAGKPVLAPDGPAIREYFSQREHLLLCDTDEKGMMQGITEIIEDKRLREHTGMEGMKKVRRDFGEENIAGAFITLARQLIR